MLKAIDRVVPRVKERLELGPEPIKFVPELGWPLTILLWMTIAWNCFLLVVPIAMLLMSNGGDALQNLSFSWAGMMGAFAPAMNIIGVIGMMRSARWGFGLFCLFTVAPAIWRFADGKLDSNTIISLGFGLSIFFLVMARWSDFE